MDCWADARPPVSDPSERDHFCRLMSSSAWTGFPRPCALDCRPPEMITLQKADALGAQYRGILGVLDAFGHCGRAEALGETEQMPEKDPLLRPAGQIAHQRAVDLDNVDR